MIRWLLVSAAALAPLGCGGSDTKQGDPDFERHLAQPLPLNKVFTDSLTPEGDDKADWKVFFVENQGLLTVTVHFDKLDSNCEVYLRDKYGAHMAKEVQSNNPYIELVRRVEPGRFFVWLNAPTPKCSSQYSIEARVEPD
ncbi:MAG: hypothetical protein KC613_21380 [Myxococcales bacterium]|nr:hypothetical protein [Myxococcales bacterium]MCB9522668.1 hypothetical protein [Myxococcales bacterium]